MQFKRALLLLSVGLFLASLISSAHGKTIACVAVLPQIEKHNQLVIGMLKSDFPPFFMNNRSGSLTGSDVSLARRLANDLHVGIKFDRRYETFNQVVEAVEKKKVDIGISFLTDTPLRETKVSFSRPYAEVKQRLIFNSEKWKYLKFTGDLMKSLNNAKVKVGVLGDSAYVSIAKELFPDAEMVALPSLEAVVKATASGQVLTGIVNDVEIKSLSMQYPDIMKGIDRVPSPNSVDRIAMAVSRDHCDLLDFINRFLDKNKVDVNIDEVFEEYRSNFK